MGEQVLEPFLGRAEEAAGTSIDRVPGPAEVPEGYVSIHGRQGESELDESVPLFSLDKGIADQGDPVAIYSSASFPGLLLNAIVAAEAMELKPMLVVSLGASTWGANLPDRPWPVLAAELRRSGFIKTRADYYTMGGGEEMGFGISPEAEALLRKAAKEAGVELLTAGNLEAMVARKAELLDRQQSRLLVSIGGSHANLGNTHEVLKLHTGLVPTTDVDLAGNGVIGVAMRNDIPVIHMLNLRSLSNMVGIVYDSPPRKMAPATTGKWWFCIGIVLFFAFLLRHRRWQMEPIDT